MSESKVKAACAHEKLELDAGATHIDGTDTFVVSVAARCARCKHRFNFVGAYDDMPTLEGASITEDRRMVLIPMRAEGRPALIVPGSVN